MDMQQMPMGNAHNTFWRDDQVTILFQSSQPLITGDGGLNPAPVKDLDLDEQRRRINDFLKRKHIPATLQFLKEIEHPFPVEANSTPNAAERVLRKAGLELPPGVYPFGFKEPIGPTDRPIATSVVSFFQIEPGPTQGASGNTSMGMSRSHGESRNENSRDDHDDDDDRDEDHDRDDGKEKGSTSHLVRRIVNALNENLEELFVNRHIPITIAAPHWLGGGTPDDTGQGCPLTPPIPVSTGDTCSNYHIQLPDLSSDLQSRTGHGVTVFILDAFPERGIISRAAQDVGARNPLLSSVDASVAFDYDLMSGVQAMQVIAETNNAFVGKDVYGQHYPILLADHGLFVAGIVHDLAPGARIECIRVLEDLCVGDLHTISRALWQIFLRKAFNTGDLFGQPVVINLSLVIPTQEEAHSQHVKTTLGDLWKNVGDPLLSLSQQGVVIAASAGNEGDLRENPAGIRPGALFPAAYGNPPTPAAPHHVVIDGVIPVGAVNGSEGPSTYSCYPGPLEYGVATYGGEVPTVVGSSTANPVSNPNVVVSDALRGIYSSVEFPPLSSVPADPSEQYYTPTNESAWAYWVGTSFATPIITAVAARILELNPGLTSKEVHQAVLALASGTTNWQNLDPATSGVGSGPVQGKVLKACQPCNPPL
jgi:subtilisin family serine protease